jgi:hypothetical protein
MFPPLLTKLKEKRVFLNLKYTNELEAQKEKKMLSPIDNMKMYIDIHKKEAKNIGLGNWSYIPRTYCL